MSTSPLRKAGSSASWSGAEPKRIILQGRSAGNASTKRSITRPAGVSQLRAGRQGCSKDGMILSQSFFCADAGQGLADQAIAHPRIIGEAPGETAVTRQQSSTI